MTAFPECLYGYIHHGEDSFIAAEIDGVWYPLIFASKEKAMAPGVVALVNEIVSATSKPASLVMWATVEPLAEISPADVSEGSAILRPKTGQFAGEVVEPIGRTDDDGETFH